MKKNTPSVASHPTAQVRAIADSNRAQAQCKLHHYSQALPDSQQALQWDANSAEAYQAQGDAYGGVGKGDRILYTIHNPSINQSNLNQH